MLTVDNRLIIPLDSILDEICQIFDVKPTELISKTRTQELVSYRSMYYYVTAFLDKKQGGVSRVSKALNQDHTSGIHQRQKIKDFLDTNDKDFMEILEKYQRKSSIYKKIEKYYTHILGKPMDYARAIEHAK